MRNYFHAVKVTDSVYWVGAIDWEIRNFHGYSTSRGTTYNAYLILADKITLIDTVKHRFKDELIERISTIVPLEDIEIIISNHAELDHSGCLPEMIDRIKPDKVIASKMGVKALKEHFNTSMDITPVTSGDTLDLGNKQLRFLETRMLHWPDSMFTYLDEEKVLFSQDAFGMHLATGTRFADEIDSSIVEYETAKYFANILLPYAAQIKRLITKINELSLDIDVIAHDHGPIFRKNIDRVINRYSTWADQKPGEKAIIVYDTMWGSTARMAQAVGDGLNHAGIPFKLLPLEGSHRSDVATELLDSGALLVGSPTLNNNMYPTIADILIYLKGLKPRNRIGASFGSYGWGGEAVKQITEYLDQMGVESQGTLKVKYVPGTDDLAECFELGLKVGTELKDRGRSLE